MGYRAISFVIFFCLIAIGPLFYCYISFSFWLQLDGPHSILVVQIDKGISKSPLNQEMLGNIFNNTYNKFMLLLAYIPSA